jgi:hypothetical protein
VRLKGVPGVVDLSVEGQTDIPTVCIRVRRKMPAALVYSRPM